MKYKIIKFLSLIYKFEMPLFMVLFHNAFISVMTKSGQQEINLINPVSVFMILILTIAIAVLNGGLEHRKYKDVVSRISSLKSEIEAAHVISESDSDEAIKKMEDNPEIVEKIEEMVRLVQGTSNLEYEDRRRILEEQSEDEVKEKSRYSDAEDAISSLWDCLITTIVMYAIIYFVKLCFGSTYELSTIQSTVIITVGLSISATLSIWSAKRI